MSLRMSLVRSRDALCLLLTTTLVVSTRAPSMKLLEVKMEVCAGSLTLPSLSCVAMQKARKMSRHR